MTRMETSSEVAACDAAATPLGTEVDRTPEAKSNLRAICGNFQKPRSAAPLVKTVGDAKLAGWRPKIS